MLDNSFFISFLYTHIYVKNVKKEMITYFGIGYMSKQKNLIMILKKEPYQVMVSGEKKVEYRDNTPYWTSRLFNKDGTTKEFQYVEFSNGYRKNRPQFKVEFKGVEVIDEVKEVYSNGFRVNYPYKKEGYYKIILGSIIV